MLKGTMGKGLAVMAGGMLATGIASLLDRFALLGTATDASIGFLHGLAILAFLVAIPLLIHGARGARRTR